MTKPELIVLVNRAFASWNQDPSAEHRKAVYTAWFEVLSDLDADACGRALTELIIEDSFFPRPGRIRKLVIDIQLPDTAPVPVEAWSQWLSYAAAVNNGHVFGELHPLVRATVAKIGSSAASMHTNGDRDKFCEIYEGVRAASDRTRYAVQR